MNMIFQSFPNPFEVLYNFIDPRQRISTFIIQYLWKGLHMLRGIKHWASTSTLDIVAIKIKNKK